MDNSEAAHHHAPEKHLRLPPRKVLWQSRCTPVIPTSVAKSFQYKGQLLPTAGSPRETLAAVHSALAWCTLSELTIDVLWQKHLLCISNDATENITHWFQLEQAREVCSEVMNRRAAMVAVFLSP